MFSKLAVKATSFRVGYREGPNVAAVMRNSLQMMSRNYQRRIPNLVKESRRTYAVEPIKPVAPRRSSQYYAKFTPTIGLGLGLGVGAMLAGLTWYNSKDNEKHSAWAAEPPAANLAQSTNVSGVHPQGAFVIITLSKDANYRQVSKAIGKLPALIKQLSPDDPKAGELPAVMAGVAFGTNLWEPIAKLYKFPLPANFGHHVGRKGVFGDMPATGGDIFLHVKAETTSLCYETVEAFLVSLPKGSVEKVDDKYSFQFKEGRDLSGFLDGTENPADQKSRREAALLPAGGSYVIHQRWVHNIPQLNTKSIAEQEKIVGRTKPDSAEFPQKEQPKTSHVSRMRDDKFQKIPIVRQSMPFGTVGGDRGLLFIAYSNSVGKFDQMLDRMVGKSGGSDNDAIMSFSKCIASQYYYAPSLKELTEMSK